ncbi:septum site-determining protein MinC [Paenibacillus polymyxa]|uniref:hypothetical protein n=1 Tax=Paenibacillus polymyxa TaxID=1406 RepID=UPI0008FB1B63|nr:hypothetical protein [Paenibacillus polymyxa]APB76461.1 septum site-determining protein MinC [Paenibacillus polymyxa]
MKYRAKIIEIKSRSFSAANVTQKIKKKDQSKYDHSEEYDGSNGTYVNKSNREYFGTVLHFKIYVYDLEKIITIDLRDYVLYKNNVKKISSRLLNYIKENNEGKKIYVYVQGGHLTVENEQFNVVRERNNTFKED